MDEIAHVAGVNKAVIYRSFDSKEEIFVLVLVDYLSELECRLGELPARKAPARALREMCECYVDFCLEYPAFADCVLALMQQPAGELRERLADVAWFRLGRSLAACLGPLELVFAAGAEGGTFAIEDPAFTANRLCVQLLGSVHLARVGVGVREAAAGVLGTFEIDGELVREACLKDALALAQATGVSG